MLTTSVTPTSFQIGVSSNYGIYSNGSAQSYLGGALTVGETLTSPIAALKNVNNIRYANQFSDRSVIKLWHLFQWECPILLGWRTNCRRNTNISDSSPKEC